jgi:hypothetical protein
MDGYTPLRLAFAFTRSDALDFFSQGLSEGRRVLQDMQDGTGRATATIERQMIQTVWQKVNCRFDVCRATYGVHTELS